MAYSWESPIFDKISSYRSTVLDKRQLTNAPGLRPPQIPVCLCPQLPLVSGARAWMETSFVCHCMFANIFKWNHNKSQYVLIL